MLIKNGKEFHQHSGRNYFSAWVSEDNGQTWKGGLVIDDREKDTYPDGFQATDGTIYVSKVNITELNGIQTQVLNMFGMKKTDIEATL